MFKYLILTLFLFSYLNSSSNLIEKFEFREDRSKKNIAPKLHPNSHINIFIPSIPYSYIAKATNSGLIRSYDNEQGFVYDLAKSHKRVDDYTYIFELRDNLKFQNGEKFTIDDAIYNLRFFEKYPYLYTNIDKVGFEVFKLDNTHLKIVLKHKDNPQSFHYLLMIYILVLMVLVFLYCTNYINAHSILVNFV